MKSNAFAICAAILLLSGIQSVGQHKHVATLKTGGRVSYVTVDRPGELYVIYEDAHIDRIGSDGKPLATYQLPFTPDHFDPRDGSRYFAYNNAENSILRFSPGNLNPADDEPVDPSLAIKPYRVCSSGDHAILILDSVDLTLRNADLKSQTVLFESQLTLPAGSVIRFMREYQNLVFMLLGNGEIAVFNKMGRKVRTLGGKGTDYFNFLGQEIYYRSGDDLVLHDLFEGTERRIKVKHPPGYVLLTDERLYVVTAENIEVFAHQNH